MPYKDVESIVDAMNSGSISEAQALIEAAGLSQQQTMDEVKAQFRQELEERDMQHAAQRFIDETPDFYDVMGLPEVEQIRKNTPIVAQYDLGAYLAYKAQAAQKEADTLRAKLSEAQRRLGVEPRSNQPQGKDQLKRDGGSFEGAMAALEACRAKQGG